MKRITGQKITYIIHYDILMKGIKLYFQSDFLSFLLSLFSFASFSNFFLILLLFFLCICCVCVCSFHRYRQSYARAHLHLRTYVGCGQEFMLSLFHLSPLWSLRQVLRLNPELKDSARLSK